MAKARTTELYSVSDGRILKDKAGKPLKELLSVLEWGELKSLYEGLTKSQLNSKIGKALKTAIENRDKEQAEAEQRPVFEKLNLCSDREPVDSPCLEMESPVKSVTLPSDEYTVSATPEFLDDMKKQGFDEKDIMKAITASKDDLTDRVLIVAVRYLEPEWEKTYEPLLKLEERGITVQYVHRHPKGFGSLAEALNRGFNKGNGKNYDYIWFVTNIAFDEDLIDRLVQAMDKTKYAAIHPCFNSDHEHIRPVEKGGIKEAAFVEFTCPIVRADVFTQYKLDEQMPYWGHDLDWSYRVRKGGYELGILHGVEIGHTYIRHSDRTNPHTLRRFKMRKAYNAQTSNALKRKYGEDWRGVMYPNREQQIRRFYDQVKPLI